MIGNNGEENTKPVANQKTQFISAPGSHERQLRERATELFSNSFVRIIFRFDSSLRIFSRFISGVIPRVIS